MLGGTLWRQPLSPVHTSIQTTFFFSLKHILTVADFFLKTWRLVFNTLNELKDQHQVLGLQNTFYFFKEILQTAAGAPAKKSSVNPVLQKKNTFFIRQSSSGEIIRSARSLCSLGFHSHHIHLACWLQYVRGGIQEESRVNMDHETMWEIPG